MSKFKIKVNIKEFSLEVEGERADIPQLTGAVKHHLSNLLTPPTALAAGGNSELQQDEKNITPPETNQDIPSRRIGRKPRRSRSDAPASEALDFAHDPDQWGHPVLDWTTAQKAIWLLYVLEQQQQIKDMSSVQIAATFNKHFRQSKTIQQSNVIRDLGKEKTKNVVGEDANQTPSHWYLTIERQDDRSKSGCRGEARVNCKRIGENGPGRASAISSKAVAAIGQNASPHTP
jgi:hypothetical protein